VVDQVGQPPFKAPQCLLRRLALAPLALVVQAAGGAWVADLDDHHHVQRVVDPLVPRPRQPVPDLLAGGSIDRGGAVVAGEGVLGGEPRHVTGLGQDPPGDHRADAEQAGQAGAWRGDRGGDLAAEVLEPGVQGADVGQVVAGDMHPDRRDVACGADPGQQRLGLVRRQLSAHAARRQLGQQPVQLAHRLGAQRPRVPHAGHTVLVLHRGRGGVDRPAGR
jgi:hypothetical protein